MQSNNIDIIEESSSTVILDIIYQLRISDAMSASPLTAKADTSMRQIKAIMKKEGITGVPIAKKERLLGIISMDDIFNAMDNGYIDEPAEKHMTKQLIILEEDMPLAFGISYFNKYKFRRFPVVNKDKRLVGMLTSRDILEKLLGEMNKAVTTLETQVKRDEPPKLTKMRKIYPIKKYDFENAGKASNEIKKLLVEHDLPKKIIRRIAVAMYELEINITVHSEGGVMDIIMDNEKVQVIAKDSAPGISDLTQALKEGFSTANEEVKSLGFGAGMGLPNIKRVSDEFDIQSKLGEGTTVKATVFLNKEETK